MKEFGTDAEIARPTRRFDRLRTIGGMGIRNWNLQDEIAGRRLQLQVGMRQAAEPRDANPIFRQPT